MLDSAKQPFGILIPAYQIGPHGLEFVLSLTQWVDQQQILIVNDCSRDLIPQQLEQQGFHVLHHIQNQGKAAALKSGFDWWLQAGAKWVICMDGDGQHAGLSLPAFLERLQCASEQTGLIIGARHLHPKSMPWPRVLSNRITTRILERLADQKLWDSQCGFRAYRLSALPKTSQTQGFQWESEVLVRMAWEGWKVAACEIPTIYGDETSSIRPWRDTMRFLRLWRKLSKEKKRWQKSPQKKEPL
jgi:glycosyltransferase involved in cell wall biosynthesis